MFNPLIPHIMEKDFNTKQEVILHLEALKEASATIETAIRLTLEVIRKFDGKQFTRRITNLAQQAVDGALGQHVVSVVFDVTDYHFGLEFYLAKRSYPVKRGSVRGGMDIVDWVNFDQDLQRSLICWDGNRYALRASDFERSASYALRWNACLVHKYQDALDRFDQHRDAYASALRSFQEACGKINPLFLDSMAYTTDARVCRTWQEEADKAVPEA